MRCELTLQETKKGIMISSPKTQVGSKPSILQSHAMLTGHAVLLSDIARALRLLPKASPKDHALELTDRDATEGPYNTSTKCNGNQSYV